MVNDVLVRPLPILYPVGDSSCLMHDTPISLLFLQLSVKHGLNLSLTEYFCGEFNPIRSGCDQLGGSKVVVGVEGASEDHVKPDAPVVCGSLY